MKSLELSTYLSSNGQVEYPVSVVVVEVFPEDKDRPPSSTSFDGELPVGIPSRDLEAYLRVGRVRLVTVQSINAPKHRQTCIQTRKQPSISILQVQRRTEQKVIAPL